MRFSEKIDFLMKLTNTKNSTLALYTSLDASHISRLRRGQRSLSKSENYVEAMSHYFARRCVDEYQRKALTEALNTGSSLPAESRSVAKLLHAWLLNESNTRNEQIEDFLTGLSGMSFKKAPGATADPSLFAPVPPKRASTTYGPEGKRAAVLSFLSLVLRDQKQQTLYLFSDEDMGWLTENKEFIQKWALLMLQIIGRGNRIIIIHTVSRDLDEMLAAIREWMPLYMTGAIEPYYYPKLRDGIFRRTLFIAPETAAVISTSLDSMVNKAANFLIRDKAVLAALLEEYKSYLALCRQLMRIFTSKDQQKYLTTLSEFEKEPADSIVTSKTLSVLTMPETVAQKIISRMGNEQRDKLFTFYKARELSFREGLTTNCFTEIIKIPEISVIKSGNVKIAFADMFNDTDLYYSTEEFTEHLGHLVKLLEDFPNFNISIDESRAEEGYMLYVKDDLGVLAGSFTVPSFIFAINESNITAAFWDFLQKKIKNNATGKRATISRLQSIISTIKEM